MIAKTFARIFYRNAINIGLAILECPAASDGIDDGDQVFRGLCHRRHYQHYQRHHLPGRAFPPFIQEMIEKGGLMASIKG